MRNSSWRVQLWLFVGTLCIYGVRALFFSVPDLIWDEARYLGGAENLVRGYFIATDDPEIINGPGYPFLLAPLVWLGASLEAMRAVNALLMALATWFTYRATLPYAGPRWALAVALVLALHPTLLYFAPYVMSEGLATSCIAGFAWAITALLRRGRTPAWLLAACVFTLAWLVLTKVLFGYVLTIAILGVAALVGLRRGATRAWVKVSTVLLLSFGLCVPYLAYTYELTGDAFKWSTNGGELLYWATSTAPGERGSWFSLEQVQENPELARHHAEFLERVQALPAAEREAEYRRRAMENLARDPVGALNNWVANVNRLLLNFPRSYRPEELKTTVLILFQFPILVLSALALFCMASTLRDTRPEILLLSALTLVYVGLSTVLPASPRYFVVVLPWIGLVVAATLAPRLRISLVSKA